MFDRPVGSMASLNSGTRPAAPPFVILTHRLICIYLLNLPPDRSPRPLIPDGSRCKKHLAIICFMARYINKTTFRGIWAQYKIDHRMFHRRPPYGFETGHSAMRLALPRYGKDSVSTRRPAPIRSCPKWFPAILSRRPIPNAVPTPTADAGGRAGRRPLLGEPRASQAGRDGQLFARSYWRWCCGRPTESDPFAKPEGMSLSRR